jgi:hypothetical protein
MSACSASRFAAFAAALGLAAAFAAAPAPALAGLTVDGVVLSDAHGRHAHGAGAAGEKSGATSGARADSAAEDTLGSGPILVHDDEGGMVRFLSDARVPKGTHFDGDVVAIFGDVRIDGEITGSAVAVFGHVDIAPGAAVHGDAVAVLGGEHSGGQVSGSSVAVLGSLKLDPGASVGGDAVAVGGRVDHPGGVRVGGESVSVGLLPLTFGLPGLPSVLAAIVLGWLVSVFFGWVFAFMFPARLARVAVTSSRRTFFSMVLAALSLLLWPVVSILVMATIIGLPLGIFLWIVYPVVVYAGQLAATYVLGCKLMRRRLGEGPAIGPITAGSGLIALLFAAAAVSYSLGGVGAALALFFGLVGALVLLGLTTIGTGAFLLSRAGSLPREFEPGAAGVSAAQASSGPVATA